MKFISYPFIFCIIFFCIFLFIISIFIIPAYKGEVIKTDIKEEKPVPLDRIKIKDIKVYPDKIVINIQNASLSRYADSGSMIPTLDYGANGIRIIPKNESDIKVGDIITYKKEESLIVHRVIEMGKDDNGTYYILKGDNNDKDDGKIRFNQIKYITIGILW